MQNQSNAAYDYAYTQAVPKQKPVVDEEVIKKPKLKKVGKLSSRQEERIANRTFAKVAFFAITFTVVAIMYVFLNSANYTLNNSIQEIKSNIIFSQAKLDDMQAKLDEATSEEVIAQVSGQLGLVKDYAGTKQYVNAVNDSEVKVYKSFEK